MGRSVSSNSINAVVSGAIVTSNAQAGPATPSILTPANNSILSSFTPTFALSTYNNNGVTQTHVATQLQIALDPGFTQVIYDTTVTSSLTSITVPANTISNTYLEIYVRIRYLSSLGYSSPYSAVYRYSVSGQFVLYGSESGSNTVFTVVYLGPGSVTSATLTIANNSSLTSPAYNSSVSFTNNIGSVTIATSSLSGYWTLATDYYFQFTGVVGTYSQTSTGLVVTPLPVDVYLTSGSSYTTASGFSGTLSFFVVGGGGGGASTTTSGGGGGGGYISQFSFNTNGALSFTYSIGAGGAGGTGFAAGSAGGNTTLTIGGITYTANGGSGGSGETGGGGGTTGGNKNANGQNSLYGGRGGVFGTQSPAVGGEGGFGYGAGGGGQTRDATFGGNGGGGGGGGGFGGIKVATDGTFSNTGPAGNGGSGLVLVRYNPT